MTQLRRVLALLLVAAVGLLAAPAGAAPSTGISATIATPYGGQIRSFNVYVAPRVPAQVPVPVIFVMHGLYLDPATTEASAGLDAIADTQDVALVYPAGVQGSWNAGTCCGESHAAKTDDVGFLVHVLGLVRQIRPIDLNRVYLAGFSNGGMMALKAVCERPDVFAAAVSVAGSLQAPCSGRQPVNAMILHGVRDTTVPYNGQRYSAFLGVPLTSAPVSAARLAARSGCTVNRVTAADRYLRRDYGGCSRGTDVQLLTVPAMGHRWPDMKRDRVDGGKLTWTFLRAQKRLA